MMLKHIAHARAEQILSPYIVATQVAHAFWARHALEKDEKYKMKGGEKC
jgi:hypothetical protein